MSYLSPFRIICPGRLYSVPLSSKTCKFALLQAKKQGLLLTDGIVFSTM